VSQLYPQALGTHFSRLLRHEWVTVGLFFNPGHYTGAVMYSPAIIFGCGDLCEGGPCVRRPSVKWSAIAEYSRNADFELVRVSV
jgi:hypothetical protein